MLFIDINQDIAAQDTEDRRESRPPYTGTVIFGSSASSARISSLSCDLRSLDDDSAGGKRTTQSVVVQDAYTRGIKVEELSLLLQSLDCELHRSGVFAFAGEF